MGAIAQPLRINGEPLARIVLSERFIGRFFAWTGLLVLFVSIVFPLHLQDRLPYNILPSLPLSFFLIIAALAIRGRQVLRRTAFDWVMFAWIALTVLCQIFVPVMLSRVFYEAEAVSVVLTLFNMWFVYRAVFAMTVVDPQAAARATMFWLLTLITACTVMGILQSVGPIQEQMVALGYKIGVGEIQIKLGASEATQVRTTAVFSGPNIFGFVNLLACCLLIGAATAYRKRLKEIHGALVLLGMGLYAYANLNSQSRVTFLLAALLGLVFLIYLIRMARWRALASAAIMFVILGAGAYVFMQQNNYSYMTSIFRTGVKQDNSYQVRMKGLESVMNIANDIPVLGAGQDYYSLVLYGKGDYYSNANGAGDNGIAMAYFLMGIPGLVHLFFLNLVIVRGLKRLKPENKTFITAIRSTGWLFFWLYLLTLPYSVRYHKIETFFYFLIVLGVVFGILSVQENRNRNMLRSGMTPEEIDAVVMKPA